MHFAQGGPRRTGTAQVRRGFHDDYAAHKGAIAKEALDRIGALFDIERMIAGKPPDVRRDVRQRTARPKIDDLAIWLDAQLQEIPGKSDLAGAIRYARSRWNALNRYLSGAWKYQTMLPRAKSGPCMARQSG